MGKPALAALLVGVVLLLDAMAACPALHEMIHHDAGKEDHDCAVTMFAHGKVRFASCEIIIPPPTRCWSRSSGISLFPFTARPSKIFPKAALRPFPPLFPSF